LTATSLISESQENPYLKIPYASGKVKIDGVVSEWKNYASYTFVDTATSLKPAGDRDIMTFYDEKYDYSNTKLPLSKNTVETRICWDLENIYFAFRVEDKHLFAEVPSDASYPEFHLNDAVEIYIDTKNDSKDRMDLNDYQFIVDIINNTVVLKGDRKFIESDTMATPKDIGQNILFESRAVYSGAINDSAGNDKGYIIEIAIPFAAIGIKPGTSHKMKLDLCIDDADYSFRYAQNMQDSANQYYALNWSGLNDFGFPEFWKPVELSGGPGWYDSITASFQKYWLLFYSLTLIVSLSVLMVLYRRIRKLKSVPAAVELGPEQSMVFKDINDIDQESMSHNQKVLQRASQIVRSRHDESINSEQLSNDLGISLRNLQRITKEEVNCTPTNFIWLVKLKLAADYLRSQEGNVSEAAYEFGFSDPSYFSRMFKKHYGISPKEYQKGNS